jgi:light-regulated signal transduction histidine kinase (bacteriophytochrome)
MRLDKCIADQIQGLGHPQAVHSPGTIQGHGVLLAFREGDLSILQVSSNAQAFLGTAPQDLLGESLNTILDNAQIAVLQDALAEDLGSVNPFELTLGTGECLFQGTVHRTANAAILELEPAPTSSTSLPFHQQARKIIAQLERTDSLQEFLALSVSEIRAMTGFDRVMVYQLDSQGAGNVVAEAIHPELQSYLGLHFPHFDIPEVSRDMYRRCRLRCAPDLMAPPVTLVSVEALTSPPLDLSRASLRSVDPCCIQFYQNMGSAALLAIGLMKDRQLWGLVSCHHTVPKALSPDLRNACDLVGQFMSLELSQKVDHTELEQMARFKAMHSEFVESIAQTQELSDALVNPTSRLLALVDAQGAAVCMGEHITLVGATPPLKGVEELLTWIDSQGHESLFFTDSLPTLYPPAQHFKDKASGLLLLRISKVRRYAILWFRPEVLQTVNWGGNPLDSVQTTANGQEILSPRASFARWQETVRLTSLPWKSYELTNALDLRNAIVGIVLKKADELAAINQELERRNQELDSFAFAASHDLKEPLRGVHNYSTILQEDYAQVLDAEGLDYLQTIVSLTQRMDKLIDVLLRFSQLGKAAMGFQDVDLNAIVTQVTEVLEASQPTQAFDIRIPRSLPTVQCDALLVHEIFTNLLSNAFKYNAQADPWAEVGYLDLSEQPLPSQPLLPDVLATPIFYIRDNGIGIRPHHQEIIFKLFKRLHAQEEYGGGAGAGLTIAQKAVERHGGKIWVESIYGQGSTFYFTLGSPST